MKLPYITMNYCTPTGFQPQDVLLREDAEALIDKLKCCGNCKHNFDADEELCAGCCEPKLKRWEMK
jgi:predicted amidophosphoribosyltransferase